MIRKEEDQEKDRVELTPPPVWKNDGRFTPLEHILRQISHLHDRGNSRAWIPVENFFYPPLDGGKPSQEIILQATVTHVHQNYKRPLEYELPLYF